MNLNKAGEYVQSMCEGGGGLSESVRGYVKIWGVRGNLNPP